MVVHIPYYVVYYTINKNPVGQSALPQISWRNYGTEF